MDVCQQGGIAPTFLSKADEFVLQTEAVNLHKVCLQQEQMDVWQQGGMAPRDINGAVDHILAGMRSP